VQLVHSRPFWNNLSEFLDILQPIHNGQSASEADNSHVGHVIPRWGGIATHLQQLVNQAPESPAALILPHLNERQERQLKPLHWAAYYLDPRNVEIAMPNQDAYNLLRRFLTRMDPGGNNRDGLPAAFTQLLLYRAREGPFAQENAPWDVAEHPIAFWSFMIEFVSHISRIAIRLFRTPCNSVPSERSFSVQNAIHDKARNRLLLARTDKLIYIYMNRRVLDRQEGDHYRWEHLEDEEMVELEDLLQMGEGRVEVEVD